MMDFRLWVLAITLTVTSLALAPSTIMIQFAEANHYCTDYKGKSKDWIEGCKQGWYDHDHCWGYYPGTGDYAKGYEVGWNKGNCR